MSRVEIVQSVASPVGDLGEAAAIVDRALRSWGLSLVEDRRQSPASGIAIWSGDSDVLWTLDGDGDPMLVLASAAAPGVPARHVDLVRTLAPGLRGATISAGISGLSHLPRVPALGQDYAALIRKADLRSWYQDGLRWPPGLDVEEVGDSVLLSRGLDLLDEDAFEALAMPQNMALWFAARPGHSQPPGLGRADRPAPDKPPATLEAVGLDPATNEVEYATDMGAGGRITWWELAALFRQVQRGALDDGRAIAGVRVVFAHADAAIANLVPLLDCGAKVFAMVEGDVRQVTWG